MRRFAQFEEKRVSISDGRVWAGMGDYRLVSPDGAHVAELTYEGEPPHGDSYHALQIDGRTFPGYAWGCLFAFTADSKHLGCSWMEHLFERKTVVIDLLKQRYFVLPKYIYNFTIDWPRVVGSREHDKGEAYIFTGQETWRAW